MTPRQLKLVSDGGHRPRQLVDGPLWMRFYSEEFWSIVALTSYYLAGPDLRRMRCRVARIR